MPNDEDARRNHLAGRLREVEASFLRQMRQRGFDPEQVENIALPGQLAKLYAEREALRAELAEIKTDS
ncbi:MAG: hypothetical protein ACREBG_04955 [Pyrinomonadaceae bacterium]